MFLKIRSEYCSLQKLPQRCVLSSKVFDLEVSKGCGFLAKGDSINGNRNAFYLKRLHFICNTVLAYCISPSGLREGSSHKAGFKANV